MKIQNTKQKYIIITLSVLVISAVVLGVLELTGKTNLLLSRNKKPSSTTKTTSTTPTAQEDYSDGDQREPGNTLSEDKGAGDITDKDGEIPKNVNTNNAITSQSGEISVYVPSPNTKIKSGQLISGTASLENIQYRIIDNVSGMIAMGTLKVVNGKFSGNINYNTTADEGRIDIYATKPDGSEYSNVEIPVKFR